MNKPNLPVSCPECGKRFPLGWSCCFRDLVYYASCYDCGLVFYAHEFDSFKIKISD